MKLKRVKPEAKPKPEPKPKPERKPKGKQKGSGLVLAGVPRVNLLPPSELQRRAAGALARRWVAGLAATALVVSGLVGAAYWQRSIAAEQLAAEQARTMELNGDLAGLSHISKALTTRAKLTDLRTQAMGNDLEWRALFSEFARALPTGAKLTGFELLTGANPVADVEPAAGIGVIGRIIVNTSDPADQNRMIDSLRGLDPVLAADAGSLTAAVDNRFDFVVEIVVDQTHYSGDHLSEGGVR